MSLVAPRITRPAKAICDVIELTEAEKNIYSGAGWKLARFDAVGELAEFFDPGKYPLPDDLGDVDGYLTVMLRAAHDWMKASPGEFWLVMCSGYQLCRPRRVTPDSASAIAHMARIFGEAHREAMEY